MPRAGLIDKVGEGERVEDVSHGIRNSNPHVLHHAVPLSVVVLIEDGRDWAVDGGYDVGQRYFLGCSRQHVPASDPALRSDDSGALDRKEYLFQIRLGKSGALGDLLDGRRPPVVVQSDGKQSAGRVVASCRNLHPYMVA